MSSTANSQAIIEIFEGPGTSEASVSKPSRKKSKIILPSPSEGDIDFVSRQGGKLYLQRFHGGQELSKQWRTTAGDESVQVHFDPEGPRGTINPDGYIAFMQGEEIEDGDAVECERIEGEKGYQPICWGTVGDDCWKAWNGKYSTLGASTISEAQAQPDPGAAATSDCVPSIRIEQHDPDNETNGNYPPSSQWTSHIWGPLTSLSRAGTQNSQTSRDQDSLPRFSTRASTYRKGRRYKSFGEELGRRRRRGGMTGFHR